MSCLLSTAVSSLLCASRSPNIFNSVLFKTLPNFWEEQHISFFASVTLSEFTRNKLNIVTVKIIERSCN